MIKPPRLIAGDAVGIISPAGPVNMAEIKEGCDSLENQGLRIHLGPHVYGRKDYLAGSDGERLSDLEAMFRNPEIKAVFCTRGGYGTLRLLDRINYELIRKNPKILMGFSDITALLLAVTKQTELVTFHGPMVKGISELPQTAWHFLVQMIFTNQPAALAPKKGRALRGGKGKGPLMGGNLSLLCQLLGTPYMPDLTGCILFIEDRGEAPYRIDRMLTHLKLTGCLEGINGLIAGQFTGCGDTGAIESLIAEKFKSMNIPIAVGFPVGHGPNNTILPLGVAAELDADMMKLTILESAVD